MITNTNISNLVLLYRTESNHRIATPSSDNDGEATFDEGAEFNFFEVNVEQSPSYDPPPKRRKTSERELGLSKFLESIQSLKDPELTQSEHFFKYLQKKVACLSKENQAKLETLFLQQCNDMEEEENIM